MPYPSRRARAFLLEGLKVLLVVLGFYLLQSQIFHMRYALYDSNRGMAHAQEMASEDLTDTQRFIQLAVEELEGNQLDISSTKSLLQESLEAMGRDREQLLRLLEAKTGELESDIRAGNDQRERDYAAVRAVAESNAARLLTITSSSGKSPQERKKKMLYPTVQLRGNGTVGSGVLIYSEKQPDVGDGEVHTTFVITAYHVVAEVLADRLEQPLREVHLMSDEESSRTRVHSARLLIFNKPMDIALLRLDSSQRFPYLAELMPDDGLDRVDIFSPAYAVGCPLGNRPLPTLGEVSSKSKVVGDQTFWMLNAPTFFGNSGGGIYSIPSCRLIGVSSMIYTYGKSNPVVVPHMGLFVPIQSIYRWLDDEGYGFVHKREPVPRHLRWKLVFVGSSTSSRPRPAVAEE